MIKGRLQKSVTVDYHNIKSKMVACRYCGKFKNSKMMMRSNVSDPDLLNSKNYYCNKACFKNHVTPSIYQKLEKWQRKEKRKSFSYTEKENTGDTVTSLPSIKLDKENIREEKENVREDKKKYGKFLDKRSNTY